MNTINNEHVRERDQPNDHSDAVSTRRRAR